MKLGGKVYAEYQVNQAGNDEFTVLYNGCPVDKTDELDHISPESGHVPLKAYGLSGISISSDVSWLTISSSNSISIQDQRQPVPASVTVKR